MHVATPVLWLLALAIVVVPLLRRIGLPSVIGFLVAGVLVGPHVSGRVENTEAVVAFAEYGVAMLMFLIGLELEPSRLWVLRRSVFGLGSLQLLATGLLLGGALMAAGEPVSVSLMIGLGLAMSSTSFALQLLSERNQLSAQHGRAAFAILLFQDIAVIPLLALMPLLAGGEDAAGQLPPLGKVLLVLGGLVLASRVLVRPVFRFVANSRTPELFTGLALLIILGVSALMESLHLSMSLGAFLAGMLMADSEYRHELEAQIQPFKGLLLGLFFMAVGMTANLPLLLQEPLGILALALGLMLAKGLVLYGVSRWHGHDHRAALRLGAALPQGGEFAFILFTGAVGLGLIESGLGERLVLVVTVSMALTPLGFVFVERVMEPRWQQAEQRRFDDVESITPHEVIIAGFGRVGQIVARVLRMHRIPFVAVESSARQVDFVRRFGNQVHYGRPDSLALLKAAGIGSARLMILAIDNVEESLRTATLVRRHFPNLPVYARARDRQHAYQLMDLGIKVVHRETYVSSLELAQDVLTGLDLTPEEAAHGVRRFREYDEQLIVRQQAIHHNEAALVESTKASMQELEALFESDARATRRAALDAD